MRIETPKKTKREEIDDLKRRVSDLEREAEDQRKRSPFVYPAPWQPFRIGDVPDYPGITKIWCMSSTSTETDREVASPSAKA